MFVILRHGIEVIDFAAKGLRNPPEIEGVRICFVVFVFRDRGNRDPCHIGQILLRYFTLVPDFTDITF